MPDGRPLFAWRNELEMLRSENDGVRRDRAEVDTLMRILNIIEIEESREHNSGDYLIRVKLMDAVTASDASELLIKAETTRV